MALWDADPALTAIVPSDRLLVGLALEEVDDFPRASVYRTGGQVDRTSDGSTEQWAGRLDIWFRDPEAGDAARSVVFHALDRQRTATGYHLRVTPGPVVQEDKEAWRYAFGLTMHGEI